MRTVSLPNEELLPEVAKMLSEGNSIVLKVKGNSMFPFIVEGKDSIVLQNAGALHSGDIVLAEITPHRYVLHRIIEIENDKITLMGDGNLSGTEQCSRENICGHAIAIIRKAKRIDCNSKKERLKIRLWQFFLPIRRYLLALYRRIVV